MSQNGKNARSKYARKDRGWESEANRDDDDGFERDISKPRGDFFPEGRSVGERHVKARPVKRDPRR